MNNNIIPLTRDFFARDTNIVSQELLGKLLHFQGKKAIITETESYIGQDDPACHAAKGRTKRTDIMFGAAGFSYVYLIYGMYYCLNFVTEQEGFPAAVLIRGAYIIDSVKLNSGSFKQDEFKENPAQHTKIREHRQMPKTSLVSSFLNDAENQYLNGPGKLCRYLGINISHNKCDITNNNEFFVSDIGLKTSFFTTPRIGITKGLDKLWRYVITTPISFLPD